MSGRYRVPKHAVTAEVTLAGLPPATLRFYLAELAQFHSGAERPSDLLMSSRAFLPAFDPVGERVVIVSRDAVMVFSVPLIEEIEGNFELGAIEEAEDAVELPLSLTLRDGIVVAGRVRFVMPEGRRRIQDFLETDEPFVLVRDDSQARFVNKRYIVKVESPT